MNKNEADEKRVQRYRRKYMEWICNYAPLDVHRRDDSGKSLTTNIPAGEYRGVLMIPSLSPEFTAWNKRLKLKEDHLSLVEKVGYPYSCLFPYLLMYLSFILGYFIRSQTYSHVFVLLLMVIPFYYREVKKLTIASFEKTMRKHNIPY